MKTLTVNRISMAGSAGDQSGSALVIALFVLALISVFVALVLSRTSAEASAVGNETAEGRTFYAAQGSLETMTRNFNKVFEVQLNPLPSDLNSVRNGTVPGLSGTYTFNQEVDQTSNSSTIVLPDGPYAGLYAIQDNWRLRTTATNGSGTQIQLTRNVLNNRIPIFQFGIFYDDDLELFRPPLFSFGGRVHSNGNFFVSPGAAGVYFDSRVTAVGQIVTQSWRNGFTGDSSNNQTFIKNASGVNQQLFPNQGSVLNGTPNIFASNPDMPSSTRNPNWSAQSAKFDGNLQSEVKPLKLPLKIGSQNQQFDLIEMVKRGKEIPTTAGGDLVNNAGTIEPVAAATTDNSIMRAERMGNKSGIRVTLADSKAKLPGCASGVGITPVSGPCGLRLDGHKSGALLTTDPQNPISVSAATSAGDIGLASRGYQPKPMRNVPGGAFNYVPTRVNGERLYTGGSREVWIKIETVQPNPVSGGIDTKDITQDILSLGVTEQARDLGSNFRISGYDSTPASSSLTASSPQTPASTGTDSRSVLKFQRFLIPGPSIPTGSTAYLTSFSDSGSTYNAVVRYTDADASEIAAGCVLGCNGQNADPNSNMERFGHLKRAERGGGGAEKAVVPFPIEMFDTREGEYYDSASYYTAGRVTRNGVMSMIDIDVANLRRFLRGDFDGLFPTDTPFALAKGSGLTDEDIPSKGGWVMYVSDRRGDADFDGEYDMEDIYGASPGNDGTLQLGEDVNKNNILDAKYISPFSDACVGVVPDCEAPKYADELLPDLAAVNDHKYYRRGVRLVNGTTIPGIYDSATAANTKGFTLASENGVYVLGNYNATGVTNVPSTGNTPYDDYRPFNNNVHIPASIVSDSVTILSNAWNDSQSFSAPYDKSSLRQATETTIRFAMISGDTIATKNASPNQGGSANGERLNGGVHNFKRFLERWSNDNLNYSGSLINLFNSHNNNGPFKCCNTVYDPPRRNWVFDSTFLDPGRLPPGTPYFQYVQTTGFQRSTN